MARTYRVIITILLIVCMLSLTGCIERYTLEDLPSEETILAYAEGHCPEPYSYLGSEVDDDNSGITYTFETDRGFEFTVHSYIDRGFLDDDSTVIRDDYANGVRSLYEDQVNFILEKNSLLEEWKFSGSNWVNTISIGSYDDLASLVQTFEEMNELWKQELSIHSHSFALATIFIRWDASMVEELSTSRSKQVGEIEINGSFDGEKILNDLQESYITMYQSGEILYFDEGYDDSNRILQELSPVLINDTTCHYIKVLYNEEKEDYLVSFVSNMTHHGTEPWKILEETASLEWDSKGEYYERNAIVRDTLKSAWCEWTINNTIWKLTIGIDRNFMGFFAEKYVILEKNGAVTDEIEFVDLNPKDDTNLSYQVSLDDFCTLFNLEYQIDYTNGIIEFESKSLIVE